MKTFDALKDMLCYEKNLNAVLHYFFDLDDNDIMTQLDSQQALEDLPHNGPYCAMLNAIRHGIHQRQHLELDTNHSYFSVAPHYHFIHGAFIIQGARIPVFYFHDIELGLYAITHGDKTDIVRFSLVSNGGIGLE